jgi:RNA polymerase sigma-54 factor
MALLQPKLNLRVSQKQILTPGLVQMVSVLALNKLELKDMINAEMVENPVLDELESPIPLLDDIARKEEERDRVTGAEEPPAPAAEASTDKNESNDPFDNIDMGAYFQEYLDPGYRSRQEWESIERPSFENFLSKPTTLTDHLTWQISSMSLRPEVLEAAELIIGNLEEDGYLTASDDELLGLTAATVSPVPEAAARKSRGTEPIAGDLSLAEENTGGIALAAGADELIETEEPEPPTQLKAEPIRPRPVFEITFDRAALQEARQIVLSLDPIGCGARDLRECLLAQLKVHQQLEDDKNGDESELMPLLKICEAVVDKHLHAVQLKQHKEIARAVSCSVEEVAQACDYLKTLDPKPGLKYNLGDTRLIEPDVAFVKHGDEYLVVMNDDDLPTLRLNPSYKRLLQRDAAEKDVRNYVKERYKSAIQLIKNIEQRKQTILKVCYSIIARQGEFLDLGIDALKPMMIKDVAEEIGVHPSTVSRAVANKYAHTPQGVFELRYFFSESVQGPEGGGTSLLILKRRVKKLIEEEDPSKPYTDEQLTAILQSQGIQVTRRTVAKYREDMKIPSTHQRRVKK